jgi:hypothetical protein
VSDKAQEDVAKQMEKRFLGQRDVKLGGEAIANAQVNSEVGTDLARAELLAFPFTRWSQLPREWRSEP